MALTFSNFRQEVRSELFNILNYWIKYDIDKEHGGFYGAVNHLNVPNPNAPKGIVINSRILWTYAAAQQLFPDPQYPVMTKRAYEYIKKYFVDPVNGGVYWSVTATGEPLEKKKQIYGHAFAIYGLAEYYKISKSEEVLDLAKDIFGQIVKHSYDSVNGGYVEALNNDWSDTDDYILSKGDSRKSMNTHLHLLESFTNLYRVWKDKSSEFHLKHCLEIMINRITDPETHRMTLFFTDKWSQDQPLFHTGMTLRPLGSSGRRQKYSEMKN
jgi:mannobiose 2-epimerase